MHLHCGYIFIPSLFKKSDHSMQCMRRTWSRCPWLKVAAIGQRGLAGGPELCMNKRSNCLTTRPNGDCSLERSTRGNLSNSSWWIFADTSRLDSDGAGPSPSSVCLSPPNQGRNLPVAILIAPHRFEFSPPILVPFLRSSTTYFSMSSNSPRSRLLSILCRSKG